MMLFDDAYEKYKAYTIIDRERCLQIWKHASRATFMAGAFAECGVFRGGSTLLMIAASHGHKDIHLFDTFKGIPEDQREKGDHPSGKFSASRDEVIHNIGIHHNRCLIHVGLVPDTLSQVFNIAFSLVHLDMDLYYPTIAALRFFWPRMVLGGSILLDDYRALKGINKAIKEFEEEIGQKCKQTANVQCSFTKGGGSVIP